MIEVRHLTKRYGGTVAVNDLSFDLQSGHIYGFLGPNGAGKSTTMNIITGCLAASEGTVSVDGLDIYENGTAVRKKLGYLPEIPPLYPEFTVCEYLSFVAEAKGLRGDKLKSEVNRVSAMTGVAEMSDRLCGNLSKGYKQRVGIAQAIIGDPELIILDEPSVGLDPEQIIETRELIRGLGSENKTVILSSHILQEISAVCDHILIINHGSLVADDTLEDLKKKYLENTNPIIRLKVRGGAKELPERVSMVAGVISAVPGGPDEDGITTINIVYDGSENVSSGIITAVMHCGGSVVGVENEQPTLESVYLDLIAANTPITSAVIYDGDTEQAQGVQEDASDEDGGEKHYTSLFSDKEDK